MTNKDKWVELFEKVAGRKPSRDEFMAGKASNFDFKQIRSIAKLDVVADKVEEVVAQVEQPSQTADVEPPLKPVQQQVESTPLVQPLQQQSEPQPVAPQQPQAVQPVVKVKKKMTKGQKIKLSLAGLGVLAVVGLGAAYWYFDQQTGPEVTVAQFNKALESNDYDQIALLLSTKTNGWSKEEAKGFLEYLQSKEIDPAAELEKLAQNGAVAVFNDNRGNKLLGLEKDGKRFGIFQEYRVATYPVDLRVSTNLDDVTVNDQAVEKGGEVSLGEVKFAPYQLAVKAKTELGDLNTSVHLDLDSIEQNTAVVALNTTAKTISASLPAGISDVKKVKLNVNGQEVAKSLSKEIQLLDNQDVEVYATFSYEGGDYTTEKTTVNLGNTEDVSVDLSLADESLKQLEEAKKVKEEKEKAEKEKQEAEKEKARQAEETKTAAEKFMTAYRAEIIYSIDKRANTFADYYDTGSVVYQEMVAYTTGGGANRASVDRNVDITFDMIGFEDLGDDKYRVTMHNVFTQYFFNGKTSRVDRNQSYWLRKDGDSFKIYDIQIGG